MRLILADPNPDVSGALLEAFYYHKSVEIYRSGFESISSDCMVSAANSFGLMDGGVDLAIRNFFGVQLQDEVQRRIIEEWCGEQPVGTSMIVRTNHLKIPWLAHTPTMRVPSVIAGTDAVYRAMFAMLQAVRAHNKSTKLARQKIRSICCPGLGTATGRVPAEEAARQMELAYRNFTNPPERISWEYAQLRAEQVKGKV